MLRLIASAFCAAVVLLAPARAQANAMELTFTGTFEGQFFNSDIFGQCGLGTDNHGPGCYQSDATAVYRFDTALGTTVTTATTLDYVQTSNFSVAITFSDAPFAKTFNPVLFFVPLHITITDDGTVSRISASLFPGIFQNTNRLISDAGNIPLSLTSPFTASANADGTGFHQFGTCPSSSSPCGTFHSTSVSLTEQQPFAVPGPTAGSGLIAMLLRRSISRFSSP